MAYIGNTPAEAFSAFQKQDFTTSATTSYTLDHPVSNQNEIALFINFVRQEPTAAYTASGTSLTLTSATSSSDDMYCVYLGKAVQTVNPSSGSVGSSQVSADLITGQTALASEPADTDEFLVSDAGTLKRIDYSLIKGGGIEVADGWRITTGFNGSGDTFITSGWEQIDDASFGSLGSAMTESSGVFTFPSTGIYLVQFQMSYHTHINGYVKGRIWITTDNSSYDKVAESIGFLQAGELAAQYSFALVDVTDTSNVKAKFGFNGANASSGAYGSTTDTQTGANFIRLGDT